MAVFQCNVMANTNISVKKLQRFTIFIIKPQSLLLNGNRSKLSVNICSGKIQVPTKHMFTHGDLVDLSV